jgi:[acyl-carrier-protein] S-malonyltransferase
VIENVSAEAKYERRKSARSIDMQVSAPVRWADSIENLIAEGVKHLSKSAQGKILAGLVRQINRDVRCLNVENSDSLKIL